MLDHETLPGSASVKTPVAEGRDFEPVEKVNWVPGVGDIYHGESRETNVHNQGISRRRTEWDLLPQTYKTPCIEAFSVPVKSHCFQRYPNSRRSALRRHCDFWDTDQDGIIYPWHIFTGFHRLGFHAILCLWAAVTMPICSSYRTQTSWLPHPLFAINLTNINCNRHGSTTGAYDMDAELDMKRFNAIFNKYAEGKDYLTWRTIYNVWRGQCCANDFFGWFAGALECVFTHKKSTEEAMTDFGQGLQCTFYFGHEMGECKGKTF